MATFSGGGTTGAGSTTLPIMSLYAAAAVAPRIQAIGVSNTTATAVKLGLVRLSTTGTQGAAITPAKTDMASGDATASLRQTHSAGPTLGNYFGPRITLGAAAGSSVIWTFRAPGLIVPVGTANGIGIIVISGTGQVCDAWIEWDE